VQTLKMAAVEMPSHVISIDVFAFFEVVLCGFCVFVPSLSLSISSLSELHRQATSQGVCVLSVNRGDRIDSATHDQDPSARWGL